MGLTMIAKCQSMDESYFSVYIKGHMYLKVVPFTLQHSVLLPLQTFFVFLGLTKKINPMLVFLTKTLLSYAATYMV